MRELQQNEVYAVSGAIDPLFLASLISGVNNYSRARTVKTCAVITGSISGVTLGFYGLAAAGPIGLAGGFVVGGVLGGAAGAIDSLIGYTIGSLFSE